MALKLHFFHGKYKYLRDLCGHSRAYLDSYLKITFTWYEFFFIYDFLASWRGEEEKKALLAGFRRNHQKVLEQEIPLEYPQNNAEVYFC